MRYFKQIAVCAVSAWISAISFAQTAPSIVISPVTPSSADTITMRIAGPVPYVGNSYRVSQEGNRLRVTLGQKFFVPPGLQPLPGNDATYVELGKLPSGNYMVDVVAPWGANQAETAIATGIPLVVADGRAVKSAPYVQLNYADHWWNPTESGWGLFIWHDNRDRVLAAWFTYGSDNKADWYTIQAGSWVFFNRYEGQVIKTTGPAFSAFVPGSAVQLQVVGSASLNFTDANNGTFTYTLAGVTQTKTITRFKQ